VADIADIAFAKHQFVADVGYVAAVAQQFEIPAAIHGVAVQAGTDQFVVFENQFFVHAAFGVAHDDFVKALATGEIAR